MPLAARGHRFRFSMGKQSAEGTPQATPAYEYSIYDMDIVPEQDVRVHEIAAATDLPGGDYIASSQMTGGVEVVTDPEAMGLFLLAHYGQDTPTGTTNFTHTFIRTETKPWMTLYQMFPGVGGGSADRWLRTSDAVAWGQTVSWNQGDPLKLRTDFLGKAGRFHVTAPVATTDVRGTTDYLNYIGATMKLDIDATPAVTQIHNLISGSIRTEYGGTAANFTDTVTPFTFDLGLYTAHFEAQAKLTNYELESLEYFGSKTAADSDFTSVVTLGGLDFLFPGSTANKSLEVQIPAMRFRASWPTLDVGGGPVVVTFSGDLRAPAAGEAITAILKNNQATY